MKTILVIEDDEAIRGNILDLLEAEGFDGIGAADGARGLEEARRTSPDLIVCDIMMPVLDGLALLERVRAEPDLAATPFIFLTARAERSDLRDGMRRGADDYITKPFTREELLDAIHSRLQRQEAVASTRTPVTPSEAKGPDRAKAFRKRLEQQTAIVRSENMRNLYMMAERAAAAPTSVLLLGETGSGKEVLAYEVHRRSPRASGPFIPINCGALAANLLESELFGHEKGAFTGAVKTRAGLFEAAHGGTVFLDEIGELDLSTQVKLLRVLNDQVVTRVGGHDALQVDVRFIAATNVDLEAAVAAGTFRQDLFFRINSITLDIPALRERGEEIAPLAEHFCQRACDKVGRSPIAISDEARAVLEAYDYPGNVRELKNAIDFAVAMCRGELIRPEHLPAKVRGDATRHTPLPRPPAAIAPAPTSAASPPAAAAAVELPPPAHTLPSRTLDELQSDMDELEKRRIMAALEQCGGNQTKAAKVLGISRRTLVSRIKKYKIPRPRKPHNV